MFLLPNLLTLIRFPLVLAFFQDNAQLRLAALILAGLTDCFDGYCARRYGQISRLGTFLDPFADKFFVIIALAVLLSENRLTSWEALAMLGRDFSVVIFGFYLAFKGTLVEYQFRAIWCGKITTTLQLLVLSGLTLGYSISPMIYLSFILLGVAALLELYLERKKLRVEN